MSHAIREALWQRLYPKLIEGGVPLQASEVDLLLSSASTFRAVISEPTSSSSDSARQGGSKYPPA
ncbi:MAG TPA: hypothetical protein VN648_24070 [Candidatus Methylomirabilis sp.]|nr:hypothetical protein [Candidatus Methylomirabilis sp.]